MWTDKRTDPARQPMQSWRGATEGLMVTVTMVLLGLLAFAGLAGFVVLCDRI